MDLRKRLWKRADASSEAISAFKCGDLPRDEDIVDFFRSPLTANDVESGNTLAWLYYDDDGKLVGLSSLGFTSWKYPGPKDVKIPFQIIPNLAVHTDHQRKGYSGQILDDTISEAVERKYTVSDLLGLFVHMQNPVAIRLYTSRGFASFGKPNGEQFQRMLLKLPD